MKTAPLRIAFVTETWPPEINGVASTVKRIVDGLLAGGHGVQLVRPRRPGEAHADTDIDTLLTGGMAIPRYPGLRMGLPATSLLQRTWRGAMPDVVHIATEGPLGWSALRAARRLGLPVSSDYRTNFDAYSRHYGLGLLHAPIGCYLRRFHNRAGCTMVPTAALRRQLRAAGFRRTVVVARGVDTSTFSPQWRSEALRASWGVRPGDTVALHVGRLAPEKNLDLVLQACDAMQLRQPRMRLVFVGDGPLRQALQQRCPEAVFAGQQRGDALSAHYASGDVFLFASRTETYGNVVPEAMASGLPVLAYDHAAAGELVTSGRNGWLAPVGDAAAYLQLARRIATDPQALKSIGAAARESALAHGWDGVLRRFEAVLLRLVRGADRDSVDVPASTTWPQTAPRWRASPATAAAASESAT